MNFNQRDASSAGVVNDYDREMSERRRKNIEDMLREYEPADRAKFSEENLKKGGKESSWTSSPIQNLVEDLVAEFAFFAEMGMRGKRKEL